MIARLLDRPVRRAAIAAGSCLLVARGLAACGSSGGDSGSSASQSAGADSFAAYQQCLSEHGVTLPSRGAGGQPGQPGEGGVPSGMPTDLPSGMPSGMPSGGPGEGGVPGGVLPSGIDSSAFSAASEACASLRPTGGPGGPGGGAGQGIDQSALAAYRSCLTDHGVTATGRLDQLSTTDPTVAKALETCAPLRPTPSAASPSASTA